MQSFAYKVKSELCRQPVSRQCCARAEAYGVLLFCNTFTAVEVRIITENPEFAARLPRLFQRAFSLKFDSLPDGTRDKLIFRITQRHKLARIVDLLGYDPSLVLHVNFGLLEDECCRTAFVRGAFLAGGSVTDPEKRYHLELATTHLRVSRELDTLLLELGQVLPLNLGQALFPGQDVHGQLLLILGVQLKHLVQVGHVLHQGDLVGLQVFHNLIHVGGGFGVPGFQGGQLILFPAEKAGKAFFLLLRVKFLQLPDQVGQGLSDLPQVLGANLLQGVFGKLGDIFLGGGAVLQHLVGVADVDLVGEGLHRLLLLLGQQFVVHLHRLDLLFLLLGDLRGLRRQRQGGHLHCGGSSGIVRGQGQLGHHVIGHGGCFLSVMFLQS